MQTMFQRSSNFPRIQKINGDMFFKFGLAAGTYFRNLKKKKQTAIIAKDTRLKKKS